MDPSNKTQNQRGQSPDDARQQQGTNDEQLQQKPLETDASWEKPGIDDDYDLDSEDNEPENDDDVSLPSSSGKENDNKRGKKDSNPNNPNSNVY